MLVRYWQAGIFFVLQAMQDPNNNQPQECTKISFTSHLLFSASIYGISVNLASLQQRPLNPNMKLEVFNKQ
jgi:hypothetical protein